MPHRNLARVLIVAGTILGIVAILAVWVSRQVMETDQWTQTSSELLEDPAVQTTVAGYLVDQLYANTDVAGELRAALPERAQPLATPAAGALRRAAEDVAERALDRPRVQQAWEQANRQAHELFVKVVEDEGEVVGTAEGVVTLDLKALLDEIAQRTGLGARAAERLPADAATIEIMRSDDLGTVQNIAGALKPLAALLVVLMLACFAGAVALSGGRRREALRGCGFALIFAGVTALVARNLIGDAVVDELATTDATTPTVEAVWEIGTSLLVDVAGATILYGVLVIAGAWLAGPARPAVSTRRALAPYLRDWRITYGAVAGIVLLVLLWGPTEGTRRVLPALILTGLLVIGVAALRRQTLHEFPNAVRGSGREAFGAFTAGANRARAAFADRRAAGAAAGPAPGAATADLERLSELHRTGELDDAEYAAAKKQVLSNV